MSLQSSAYPQVVARGTRWCLEHAWATLGITLALLVASTVVASRLTVDPSPEAYLRGAAEFDEFARIDRTFGIGETIVVALHERGGTIFDAETVRAVAELDRRVERMAGVKRVLSIASASVLGDVGKEGAEDVIDVGRLLPSGEVTDASAAVLERRIVGHQIYPRVLIDKTQETAFLLVQLDSDNTDPVSRLAAVRALRTEADRFRTESRTVHLAGTPVTKEAIASGVEHDTLIFFPATLAVLVILLFLMFGDLLASLIPIAVIGFSSIVVIGLLGLFGIPLNQATVMVPTVVLVVGLADSVHLVAELRRQYARTSDRALALERTIRAIAAPCLLTSATSALGFAALIFSRIVPLREFGIAAASGLMIAYLGTMWLTPALLAAVNYPKEGSREFVAAPRMAAVLTRLAVAIAGRSVIVPIAATGLLVGFCLATLPALNVDSDFVGYLDENHRVRQDITVVGHTLGGSDTLEVVFSGPTAGAFSEPALLAKADVAVDAVRAVEGVRGALSFVDYLKLANSVLDTERGFALPETREAVSQVLLLEAEGFPALASPDSQEIRTSIQVPSMPSEAMRRLGAEVKRAAEGALVGTDVKVIVTGIPLLFAEVARYFIEDAAASFGLVAIVIWVALLIGLRRPSLASVAMIPSLLPVGLTFATMAIFGVTFDTNSAFVACVGLGVAVDDTVHIISRYQRAQEEGAPHSVRALRYALAHAGHPVVLTSVLLALGFSVLCLSSFQPTVRVGMLSALLVTYAALFDLCFLPALLLAVDRFTNHFEPEVLARPSHITGSFGEALSHITSVEEPSSPHIDRDDDDR